INDHVGVIHGVVHSVAFANTEDLQGNYSDTSRDGYLLAQEISSYSLVAVTRAARPYMTEGGSIVTQTYLGAEKVVKNYNVMGAAKAALEVSVKYLAEDVGKDNIRVNAISAGAIRTLSAKGVSGLNEIHSVIEERAPLRRNTNQDEVGDATMFLISDLSRGITGERSEEHTSELQSYTTHFRSKYLAEDVGKDNIRVNAISAGAIRTLSAKGVSGLNEIHSVIEERAPLRRNTNQDEVGDATMFLISDLSRGITGE